MKLTDTWLLAKKILVGVVITIVPLAMLAGGLWLTQRFAGHPAPANQVSSTKGASYAN